MGDGQLEAREDQTPGLSYARVLTDEEAAQVEMTPPDLASLICSFCWKSREQVPHLFSGRGVTDPNTGAVIRPVYICDECVTRCAAALAQDRDVGR
jgi:hypothetical protein